MPPDSLALSHTHTNTDEHCQIPTKDAGLSLAAEMRSSRCAACSAVKLRGIGDVEETGGDTMKDTEIQSLKTKQTFCRKAWWWSLVLSGADDTAWLCTTYTAYDPDSQFSPGKTQTAELSDSSSCCSSPIFPSTGFCEEEYVLPWHALSWGVLCTAQSGAHVICTINACRCYIC